jgi:hypothetical protein
MTPYRPINSYRRSEAYFHYLQDRDPENEGSMVLRKVNSYLPANTPSYSGRLQLLREPEVSQSKIFFQPWCTVTSRSKVSQTAHFLVNINTSNNFNTNVINRHVTKAQPASGNGLNSAITVSWLAIHRPICENAIPVTQRHSLLFSPYVDTTIHKSQNLGLYWKYLINNLFKKVNQFT